MTRINLIPAHRLVARRRRVVRNRCVAGCAAYGILAAAVAGTCQVTWGRGDSDVTDRLGALTSEVETGEKALADAKGKLEGLQSTLRANRSITEQPDWSSLLALLAAEAKDDIVFRSVAVRPRDAGPAAAAAPAGRKPAAKAVPAEPVMLVSLAGRGRSQAAVSRFVLRLEATRLFGSVNLIETSRDPSEAGDVIAFRVECSLDEPPTVAEAEGSATPTPADNAPGARRRASHE